MSDEDETEKSRWNLRTSIDIDETLTWGELRRFVQICRGIPDSATVGIGFAEDGDVESLYGYVPVENET